MGRTPEGNPPEKPGFMVIGTQNPATYAGRHRASTALARRLTKFEFPNYSKDDLAYILSDKGLDLDTAKVYIDAFFAATEEAKIHHYRPIPSVRDLFKTVKGLLDSMVLMSPHEEEAEIGFNFFDKRNRTYDSEPGHKKIRFA